MQYKKMVIAVGMFISVVAVLVIAGIFYVVQKKGLFVEKFYYHLFAQSGAGLSEGMPVEFSGFAIGTVSELMLTNEGYVEILIEIPEPQKRWLKVDSVFVLDKPLIGSAKIQVVSQDLTSAPLEVDETRAIIFSEGIDGLIAQVQPILYDLQGILSNLNMMTQEGSDIAKILHHVEVTTKKISQTQAIVKVDETIEQIQGVITAMQTQISGLIDEAQGQLLGEQNSTMSTVNAMLEDVADKLKRLDQTVDAVNASSGDISGMTQEITYTLKKTDSLIEGLNRLIGSAPKGEVVLP